MFYIFILIIAFVLIKYIINPSFKTSRRIRRKTNYYDDFQPNDYQSTNNITTYAKKNILTAPELKFYNILITLSDRYHIIPQVCLASIINKESNSRNYTDLYRIIDFAIFKKDLSDVLLLIELNDQTHNQYNRRDRDLKVKKICNDAGIPIMNFYTKYPNEHSYVIDRVLKELEKESVHPTLAEN